MAVVDTLLSYAMYLDAFDIEGLHSVFADDISFSARFVNLGSGLDEQTGTAREVSPPLISGRDQVIQFIRMMTSDLSWQQHILDVYHVDIVGNVASATTYMTSFKTRTANRDEVVVVVARYHDRLRDVSGRWFITSKQMDVGWMETRHANPSELAAAYVARSHACADALRATESSVDRKAPT